MSIKSISLIVSTFIISGGVSAAPISGMGTWESTLLARDLDGNTSSIEAFYDTTKNITWLADTTAVGFTTWGGANDRAANLVVDGISGWRLPSTQQPDASCSSQSANASTAFGCTGSEMGNLFYNVLGNTSNSLSNTGLFSNVATGLNDFYWSEEYAPFTQSAWVFYMGIGFQNAIGKGNNGYIWAVHDGDIGSAISSSTVPVPAAVWLFGSGLIGLIGVARRKNK